MQYAALWPRSEIILRGLNADLIPMCSSPVQVNGTDPSFSCTYTCFLTHQLLRAPSEISIITKKQAFEPLVGVSIGCTLFFDCSVGILACCLTTRKQTEQELRETLGRNEFRDGDPPKVHRSRRTPVKGQERGSKRTNSIEIPPVSVGSTL